MSKVTIGQTLEIIPSFFEINLNISKDGQLLFNKLSQVIDFDEGFIYFINPETLQLKYSYKNTKWVQIPITKKRAPFLELFTNW